MYSICEKWRGTDFSSLLWVYSQNNHIYLPLPNFSFMLIHSLLQTILQIVFTGTRLSTYTDTRWGIFPYLLCVCVYMYKWWGRKGQPPVPSSGILLFAIWAHVAVTILQFCIKVLITKLWNMLWPQKWKQFMSLLLHLLKNSVTYIKVFSYILSRDERNMITSSLSLAVAFFYGILCL